MTDYVKGALACTAVPIYIILFHWLWFKLTKVKLWHENLFVGALVPIWVPFALYLVFYALPLLVGKELL